MSMKWKHYPLADNHPKGMKGILGNLSAGAREHTLSRKLLARFSGETGALMAIAFESLDLDRTTDYAYGGYYGGKALMEAVAGQEIRMHDCPIGGLILFLEDFLRGSEHAVVLCENPTDTRTEYLTNWRPRESRVVFFGEEVYHVVTRQEANFQSIETAIRESRGQWSISVCALCEELPQGDIPSEAFFDAIVANTAHVFASAFDGEGYLIWSPRDRRDQGSEGIGVTAPS